MPDGTKVNPKYLEAYKKMNPNAVEGKDYFLEGKTYDKPSSNNTSKQTSSGVVSSTTSTTKEDDESTPFRGMLVESAAAKAKEENKSAVNKGSNSSLDRMVSLANNNNSLIKNYNPVQDFKPKSAVQQSIDTPDALLERGEDGWLNTREVQNSLKLQKSLKQKTGQFSKGDEVEYQNKKQKLSEVDHQERNRRNEEYRRDQMYGGYGGITTGGLNVANAFSKDVTGTGLLGVGKEGARWAPGTGEVMDFAEMSSDFAKGNYGDAAISAIATGLPIIPAKSTKKAVKSIRKTLGFGRNSARVAKIANQVKKYEKSLNQFSPGGKIDEIIKASGRRAPILRGKVMSTGSKVKKYKKKLDKTVETFSGSEDQDKNIAIKKSGVTKPTG